MGRCVMLYPMKWEEDWPVVGPEGKPGKGVVTYRKPAVKAKQEITFPNIRMISVLRNWLMCGNSIMYPGKINGA